MGSKLDSKMILSDTICFKTNHLSCVNKQEVSIVEPWTTWRREWLGMPTLHSGKSSYNFYWPSLPVVLREQIQPTMHPIVLWQLLLKKKNLHISGPVQFKPMLFKGQLYILKKQYNWVQIIYQQSTHLFMPPLMCQALHSGEWNLVLAVVEYKPRQEDCFFQQQMLLQDIGLSIFLYYYVPLSFSIQLSFLFITALIFFVLKLYIPSLHSSLLIEFICIHFLIDNQSSS